jgi:hypothetical protein
MENNIHLIIDKFNKKFNNIIEQFCNLNLLKIYNELEIIYYELINIQCESIYDRSIKLKLENDINELILFILNLNKKYK